MPPPLQTTASHAAPGSPPAPLDRYAVLGHPVAHSQSPFIHAEFARQTGQLLDYGRLDCPLGAFEATLQHWLASADLTADVAAGLGPVRGCNITVPFKFQVLPLARHITARAQLAQAANTLRIEADADGQPAWTADNTDGVGLVRDLQDHAGFQLAGQRVLLIGAGGAAAGVLGPLIQAGCAAITVANRTVARAENLLQRHQAWGLQHQVALQASGLGHCGTGHDLVINSSASSLAGDPVPVPASVLRPGALAVDLMYGPAAQPFLAWATQHGATGRDGLGMLVEQAAESFLLWRGMRPITAPVLAAMRARLAG